VGITDSLLSPKRKECNAISLAIRLLSLSVDKSSIVTSLEGAKQVAPPVQAEPSLPAGMRSASTNWPFQLTWEEEKPPPLDAFNPMGIFTGIEPPLELASALRKGNPATGLGVKGAASALIRADRHRITALQTLAIKGMDERKEGRKANPLAKPGP